MDKFGRRPPLILTTDYKATRNMRPSIERSVTEASDNGSPLILNKGRGAMSLLSATSEKLAETIQ